MCENLDPNRNRCDVCRTINLAKHLRQPKPNLEAYEKCSPTQKMDCPRVTELPLNPTCIKVLTKEEFHMKQTGGRKAIVCPRPIYGHGKLMYAFKAGILVGAVYFTYTQGVWGDQQDVTECILRWQEYMRSLNTRRPPAFDQCGNVIQSQSSQGLVAPIYAGYKSFITTCFSGIVKIPVVIKCSYIEYLKQLEKRKDELELERKIKKRS